MLNAAIIGLGWWGQRLVQAAQGSGLIRFARAVTLEPELAREFAAANGLAVGTSLEDAVADPAVGAGVTGVRPRARPPRTPARGRRHPRPAARARERRDRHALDHAQDAVRLAARGLRR